MTASNQTYTRLCSPPSSITSSGSGTPQSMSRVIARSCRPSRTNPSAQLMTCGRQPTRLSSQASRRSASRGSSRNQCSVSRNSGVAPVIFERGATRSTGSSVAPQASHWSPRAPSDPQRGQVPST